MCGWSVSFEHIELKIKINIEFLDNVSLLGSTNIMNPHGDNSMYFQVLTCIKMGSQCKINIKKENRRHINKYELNLFLASHCRFYLINKWMKQLIIAKK